MFARRRLLELATVSVAAILVAAAPGARAADAGAQAASLAWDKAYNAGDVAALGTLYESDAVSMGPGAPALAGRDAIEADFRKFFAANTGRHRTVDPVWQPFGDMVAERGRYEATTTPRNGAKPSHEKGKHIVVWHKGGDGHWRVMWEIWNTD